MKKIYGWTPIELLDYDNKVEVGIAIGYMIALIALGIFIMWMALS